MIVVADASPLIVLVNIGHVEILPKLFQSVIVPPAVYDEVCAAHRPVPVRNFFVSGPDWLVVQPPQKTLDIPSLHRGEAEALSLAMEVHADLLLVDERKAYKAAMARKVNAIGTLRVLDRAAEARLLSLADAFERLKQTDFWISTDILDDLLKAHLRKFPSPPS